MTYLNEAAALVGRLGDFMNDPQIRLADGQCHTDLEGFPFSFFYAEKSSTLFIQSTLGPLANCPDQGAALEALLEANHLGGGTAGGLFGLNPDDGHLYYSYRLDFPLSAEPVYDDLLIDLLPRIIGALEAAEDLIG